jgi:uncharacterized protein YbjT (DUF2867 family)
MRVAVVGATGRIGRLTVGALERRGHEAVGISRTQGVDVYTGDGLVTALTGVDAVVDACSCAATDRDEAVAFFSQSTRNLLEAERQTGVQHHVLLSIIGLTKVTGNAQDLVDLAQRTRAARGAPIRLVRTWSGVFGVHMAGDVLLPEPDARIAPTTFDDWLAGETRSSR